MNTRTLKKHLKYKIPQIKLAILREPSQDPLPGIRTPEDLTQYLEPMKHLRRTFRCSAPRCQESIDGLSRSFSWNPVGKPGSPKRGV